MSTEFYPLTISDVERLTKDSVAISFAVPMELKEKFAYKQGQHLTLRSAIDGQDIRRSYSVCQGIDSDHLKVGIKAIENGVFSNYANQQLQTGMQIEVMPPQGHFYTELSETSHKNYLMIAVGSGITPILSNIESIFSTEPDARITLLYGNKKTPLMMFRENLSFVKNKNMAHFQWLNFFTEEENDSEILNGRINAQKLIDLDKSRMIDLKSFDEFLVCGPEKMTLEIASALEYWSFDKSKIHYELFFSGNEEIKTEKLQEQRSKKYGHKISSVSVKVSGRKTKMQLEMGGENILDAAMEQGADLPFSCKGGVCATCKAKVIKGNVEMDVSHGLTEQEIKEGMILTCQAHPISDEVEIDFDFS